MSDLPGRFQLVKYVAGELSPDECGVLESHLGECNLCRDALDEIQNHVSEYDAVADVQLARLVEKISAKPASGRRRRWLQGIGLALAVATVMLLVLVWTGGRSGDIAYKGAFSLKIVAQKTDGQIFVRAGERLTRGDALRFVIASDSAGFVSVFSVDAKGRLNPFYPESDPATYPDPIKIDREGDHELPGSVILDDWVGEEYLVVVFSRKSFDRRQVDLAIKRAILEGGPQAVNPAVLGVEGSVAVVPIVKVEGQAR